MPELLCLCSQNHSCSEASAVLGSDDLVIYGAELQYSVGSPLYETLCDLLAAYACSQGSLDELALV